MPNVVVLRLVRLHVLHDCEARLNVLPNSLKSLWRWFMVEKWTFNSWATALVDIPDIPARSLKTWVSVASCCVIKLHILDWPFIVGSPSHTFFGPFFLGLLCT